MNMVCHVVERNKRAMIQTQRVTWARYLSTIRTQTNRYAGHTPQHAYISLWFPLYFFFISVMRLYFTCMDYCCMYVPYSFQLIINDWCFLSRIVFESFILWKGHCYNWCFFVCKYSVIFFVQSLLVLFFNVFFFVFVI